MLTPPYNLQHNDIAKWKHRHLVEIGLTLMHQTCLPLVFWSHAFKTTIDLINCMPTLIFYHKSLFFKLFGSETHYIKLKVFGCLCYPWLEPYTSNKLYTKSKPYIFLGYSSQQSANLYFN